jgi:hypothetical protein
LESTQNSCSPTQLDHQSSGDRIEITLSLNQHNNQPYEMDQLKGALGSFSGGDKKNTQEGMSQASTEETSQKSSGGGGFLGGLGEKFNSAAGGGKESEKNEDYLDKGEFVQ